MTRHLIYIHSRDHKRADRGYAYDVPENSVFESDCDLDALLKAVDADKHLPWDERGYRYRGPMFYCAKCNLIVLEWDSPSAMTCSGIAGDVGEMVCAECWNCLKHNIVITPHGERDSA
jgi:hypothetical protein